MGYFSRRSSSEYVLTNNQSTDSKTRYGAQIPRDGLQSAETIAKQLWEMSRGAPVAVAAFAKHLNSKPTSGGFRTKLALLRYFGLVVSEDDKIKLSDIGKDVIRDDDPSRRQSARQKAFRAVPQYNELLTRYAEGGLPSLDSVTKSLHFEFSLSEDAAERAANAFVTSARLAGLVSDDGTLDASLVAEEGSEKTDSSLAEEAPDGEQQGHQRASQGERSQRPTSGPVTLSISLDLSGFEVGDVLRVLSALGFVRDDQSEE